VGKDSSNLSVNPSGFTTAGMVCWEERKGSYVGWGSAMGGEGGPVAHPVKIISIRMAICLIFLCEVGGMGVSSFA